ncbi:MAG: hypothetical protein J5921_01325 [Clostridia bacterium]|nr:hypothetical protein [Clostridia bacterium]
MNENDRKTLKLQLILMVAGILVIPGAVIGVYTLIGRFHWNVITAAFLGAIVAFLYQLLLIISIGRVFDSAAKERGTGEMTEEEIAAFKEKYKKRVNNSAKISYLMRLPLLGAAALCVFLIPAVFNAIAFVAALIAEHILVLLSGVIIKGRV